MYMATSALRSRSSASGVSTSSPTRQMPTLARGKTFLPLISTGRSSARRIRAAASAASAEPATPSSRTANSSPPKRATVSVGRTAILQPAADLLEHLVARGVAEAVVDGLEVVEVDEHDRDLRNAAPGAHQGVLDPVGEERAVRELRHRIVEGLVRELFLERLALADVAAVEDDAADVLVVEQVGVLDLEPECRAVAGAAASIRSVCASARPVPSTEISCASNGRSPSVSRCSKRVPSTSSAE